MLAHELKPARGSKHARKRVGRGNASGHGTYSGRGSKGQKARAGRTPKLGFEGGQTKLIKRMPRRRGFRNPFRTEYSPVNLSDLRVFPEGTEVTPELLKERGILRSLRRPVKVLAVGELTKPVTVKVHKLSLAARKKIEAIGGSAVELGDGVSG
ncbi:MAG: 50S ribosomal protein L15 [Dehalococcoidia bacterium]